MGVFTETDAATLYDAVINKIQEDVGETLYPGDERRIFGEAIVALFVVIFNSIDDAAKQSLLKYARGNILDAIGDGYNCTRLEAEKSKTILRFSMNSIYDTDITIPAGSRAATDDGLYFETDKDVTIKQGEIIADVSASAIAGGTEYNGYLPGSVTIMVDLLSFVDAVANTTATEDGTDKETDDDYRNRIRLALSKFSTAGPMNAWKYWTLSADSGIADAHIENPSANEIVITAIMSDGKIPDADMLAKITSVVGADDVRPLGDHITVKAPQLSEYAIEMVYYVTSESESMAIAAIENETFSDVSGVKHTGAIAAYKIWQDTTIARNINPDKLKSLVMNPAGDGSVPGAYRVEITSPTFKELTGDFVAHFSGTTNVSHVVKDDI